MRQIIKKLVVLNLTILILSISSLAQAAFYQHTPSVPDIYDLDHYKYYSWGIVWAPQPNEKIVWAQISIKNINNWTVEEDRLYINLLDYAQSGLRIFHDDQGGGNNFNTWASNHYLLDTYTDLFDSPGPAENYNYLFDSTELAYLNQWIADGNIGLGFDPDCHYFNDGVKFKFKTEINTVPEPGTIALFASGLIGSLGLRRKIKA